MQCVKDFRGSDQRKNDQRGLIGKRGRGIERRCVKIEETFPEELGHFHGVVGKVPIREAK